MTRLQCVKQGNCSQCLLLCFYFCTNAIVLVSVCLCWVSPPVLTVPKLYQKIYKQSQWVIIALFSAVSNVVMSKYLVWHTSSTLRKLLETMFLSLSSFRPSTPHRERSEIRICTVHCLSISGFQSNVLNVKGLLILFPYRLILSSHFDPKGLLALAQCMLQLYKLQPL